jgi:hypothetical protein
MNLGEMIVAISASVGGSAVLIAVIGFLSRSLLSNFLSKDIEAFKANLQMESQREITKLKSSLELIAFEHQVRFSRLHEKRAEVIATLYGKIDELYRVVYEFVRSYPHMEELRKDQKIENIQDYANEFKVYFSIHKIYFDPNVCGKIISFQEELSHTCSTLISFHKDRGVINIPEGAEHKEWLKSMSLIEREVEDIKRVLETSFREILGVLIKPAS